MFFGVFRFAKKREIVCAGPLVVVTAFYYGIKPCFIGIGSGAFRGSYVQKMRSPNPIGLFNGNWIDMEGLQ